MMKNLIKISKSQFKIISKLKLKKYRDLYNKFFIEGKRAVIEALKSNWDIESVLINENSDYTQHHKQQIELAEKRKIPCYLIQNKDFNKLTDTITSQGIIALSKKREFSFDQVLKLNLNHSCIVALDKISDPGNLGTILRICDWFAVDAVLIGKNSADLYNPKVVRSTMGSIFHLNIVDDVDLTKALAELKMIGYQIYSTILEGENIYRANFNLKTVIIFGSEADGISEELVKLSDKKITIPRFGKAESLNVASATAITLSYYKSKTTAVNKNEK